MSSVGPILNDSLLMFNLCDQLPGGDFILETLVNMSYSRESEHENDSKPENGMYSLSVLDTVSNLGFVFGTSSNSSNEGRIAVGEITVGEMTLLEKVVKESKNNYKKVVSAQATVDGVKVDGIDTNLAVMKELLFPFDELRKSLQSLAYWDDPLKSSGFCLFFGYIIWRGWLGYAAALVLVLVASFMIITRWFNQGRSVTEVKVVAPPPMNTMEQLLAVQTAVSQAEQLIQDGNIVLLKFRGLLLSIFPQATEKMAFALLSAGLMLALLPIKYIVLLCSWRYLQCIHLQGKLAQRDGRGDLGNGGSAYRLLLLNLKEIKRTRRKSDDDDEIFGGEVMYMIVLDIYLCSLL
jgi:hypothetical protein